MTFFPWRVPAQKKRGNDNISPHTEWKCRKNSYSTLPLTPEYSNFKWIHCIEDVLYFSVCNQKKVKSSFHEWSLNVIKNLEWLSCSRRKSYENFKPLQHFFGILLFANLKLFSIVLMWEALFAFLFESFLSAQLHSAQCSWTNKTNPSGDRYYMCVVRHESTIQIVWAWK